MVDDVIAASKCGKQTILVNSAVTTFVKLKKLELSDKNVQDYTLEKIPATVALK